MPLGCPRDTQPPSGQPQGQQRCLWQLRRCKSPYSAREQRIWTCSCPAFLFNGHFPPRSLSFQVQSFFSPNSSILRMLRQLETLPKARRGKHITLLQNELVRPGLCNPKRRFIREQGCAPCAERQEGEGGALCSVLEVTEGRKQGLLWAEQRTAKEGHNGCSPYLPGSRQELPDGFNPFSAVSASLLPG